MNVNECAQNDANLYSKVFLGISYLIAKEKFVKGVEQIYYEQAHINLKSYRQWKSFF